MQHGRILIIDDDIDLQTIIRIELEPSNFEVLAASDGQIGLDMALSEKPDLIILDINLPTLDGLSVCRGVRTKSVVPILMLSSLQQDYDKIVGLEVGADDYLGKPFNPRELLARVRALLRRFQRSQVHNTPVPETGASLVYKGIKLNSKTYTVWSDGDELSLTPIEFSLLETLLLHQGQVLTRQQLLDKVWGFDFVGTERTVDTHIRNLRLKMGEQSQVVESVRGVGFKLS